MYRLFSFPTTYSKIGLIKDMYTQAEFILKKNIDLLEFINLSLL